MDDLSIFVQTVLENPLARLALAAILGSLIGIERESRAKPAGLRTVVLICMGAELFTEASLAAASLTPTSLTRADPARIAAQIVTGVGFLGAGTILVNRGKVVGLTTAASVWVAAAIGTSVGLSMFPLAVGGTLLVVMVLAVVGRLEAGTLEQEAGILRLTVRGARHPLVGGDLDVAGMEARLVDFARENGTTRVAYRFRGHRKDREALVTRLFEDEQVISFAFE